MKVAGCIWVVAGLGLVAGCTSQATSGRPPAPEAPAAFREGTAESRGYPATPAPPAAYAPPSGASAPAAPSSPAPVAEESASAPADRGDSEASRRPGLGTEWGETRTSHVHDVEFVRASEAPYSVASLRYDDRAGVESLTSRQGGVSARNAREVVTARGAIDVSLRDDRGSSMEVWRAGGQSYVVGRAGQRYTIFLHNRTGHRFEVVTTVDGLDVIDGQPGALAKRGYLIPPFATFEIEGFRRSEDAVAAFRFGRVGDSYAAQTGSARDVGVIGAAVFAEQGDRFGDDDARQRETATPFPGDLRYAQPPPR